MVSFALLIQVIMLVVLVVLGLAALKLQPAL